MWCWRRLGGFPGGSVIKNLSANAEDAGDVGSISGLGLSAGDSDRLPTLVFLCFPCGSAGKESSCNAGDLGLNIHWKD